jgi:hypothetical protein
MAKRSENPLLFGRRTEVEVLASERPVLKRALLAAGLGHDVVAYLAKEPPKLQARHGEVFHQRFRIGAVAGTVECRLALLGGALQ